MPPVKLDPNSWKRSLRRVLIVGPPNSRKTTSLQTWPGPTQYVIYPGEKGNASLPADAQGFMWGDMDTYPSSAALVKEIEDTTWLVLSGKNGPVTHFAGDGLHKLYYAYLDKATGGALRKGEEFEPRLYGRAHEEFLHYLDRVMRSPVDYVTFTVWDGREADNPEAGSKGATHIYPDLPGKLAKRIMGEFSVVLYAEVAPPTPAATPGAPPKPGQATWQLQPGGRVWGAGVKVPAALASKLPVKVPQDWQALEKLLTTEVAA